MYKENKEAITSTVATIKKNNNKYNHLKITLFQKF